MRQQNTPIKGIAKRKRSPKSTKKTGLWGHVRSFETQYPLVVAVLRHRYIYTYIHGQEPSMYYIYLSIYRRSGNIDDDSALTRKEFALRHRRRERAPNRKSINLDTTHHYRLSSNSPNNSACPPPPFHLRAKRKQK